MIAPDLTASGIFTVTEAAYLVGVSERKVRGWIAGYPRRNASPIIQNDLGWIGGRLAFSFRNLMEMRFIALFERAGVSFNHIRAIMSEVKVVAQHPHPFATNIVFKTDGRKIVGEIVSSTTGTAIYDLRTKNLEMSHVVYMSLKSDVEYDFNGDAKSWYPRRSIAPNVIIHPQFAFGRPILRASCIPTRTIADAVKAEGSLVAAADWFALPARQVREAVTFETQLRLVA